MKFGEVFMGLRDLYLVYPFIDDNRIQEALR